MWVCQLVGQQLADAGKHQQQAEQGGDTAGGAPDQEAEGDREHADEGQVAGDADDRAPGVRRGEGGPVGGEEVLAEDEGDERRDRASARR